MLDILRAELAVAMILTGCNSARDAGARAARSGRLTDPRHPETPSIPVD